MIVPQNSDFITPEGLADFWPRILDARHRLLGLDYDGTLAPFAVEPMQARPLEGVIELLQDLARNRGTIPVVISGRPAAEVAILLARPPVTIIGSHGFEHWPVGGKLETRQPSPLQKQGLNRAHSSASRSGHGYRLEEKVASLALHTRHLPEETANAVESEIADAWGKLAGQHDLECRRFNGGMEIRCADWHKGKALAMLLARQPAETLAVYIGDDDTDEDAFAILQGRGLGIRVGGSLTSTAAAGFLPDCRAVVELLRAWKSQVA